MSLKTTRKKYFLNKHHNYVLYLRAYFVKFYNVFTGNWQITIVVSTAEGPVTIRT